ncbi:short chain dehydrogenase [Aspergillus heteromorphus CBS 117.55]|uniref:Short chain dehydrogenase n=1 Tax=Aspergillus heteromorphus CBS 117.55 TaxID=1448321 RepID=A0A317V047_9EURO|nr:short chain dehydrogenase [Aspergillus heteromorphus CBS 117.55]PWY66741.1 short chain dehydrogenase [Aspergillus heteromorphus CBS 117.55]
MAKSEGENILPFSVNGKTAIITGAGSGINLAFATLLLARNCNVVIADIGLRPEAEQLIAKYDAADGPPRAIFVRTDVTSWTDLNRMFERALSVFEEFHIVCPGAGVYEPYWSNFWHPPGSQASRDNEDGDRYALFDINMIHPIRTTQLALSHWLHPGSPNSDPVSPQNPRRVIHISSVAGQMPNVVCPMYGASKAATTGFVRCLGPLEQTVGVRVNAVAPGLIRTPLWTDNPEKMMLLDEKDGWATPNEVAVAMLRCVEESDLPGGTILEVLRNTTRNVEALNDPGPGGISGDASVGSNNAKGADQILGWLQEKEIWGRRPTAA